MNPIKWWLNWKPPKDTSWVPYALIIAALIVIGAIVIVPRLP